MHKTVKLLIFSDIFLLTGFGLISPILAIFIKEDLVGGSLMAAGLATTLYLVVKSLFQLPLSKFVDSHRHKVNFLIIGTFLIFVIPFIYAFSTSIYHIYIAQIIYGIGAALAAPTWLSLFSMHIDQKHRGYEWAVYSTSVGIGTAISAYLGALLANIFGFRIVFFIVGFFSLVGFAILFALEKKKHKSPLWYFDHHKKLTQRPFGQQIV